MFVIRLAMKAGLVITLCMVSFSHQTCFSQDENVVSFCTMSNSNATTVYIDSSLVPRNQNITCFCTIYVDRNVTVTAVMVEKDDQLDTSFNYGTFTGPFLNAFSYVFGKGVVVLRYTTYDRKLTTLCLRLDGNSMQVSCERLIYNATVRVPTFTYPHTEYNDTHNRSSATLLFSSTLDPKTTTGTAKENKHLQNVAIGAGTGVAGLLILVAVVVAVICFRRIKQRQCKPESDVQAAYLTPQTVTGRELDQIKPDEGGAQTSSAVYENDNKAYVNITDTVTVPEYEGLEEANEYSNTAHIYSDLK